MAEIFQRVPWRSLKPNSSGPKPIENTSTRTPHQRATRKWPSSWKNTTIVSTNRNGSSQPVTPPPHKLKLLEETHEPMNPSPHGQSLAATLSRMPLRQFRARVRRANNLESWSIASASSTLAGSRSDSAARGSFKGGLDQRRNSGKSEASGREIRATATSLAAFSTVGAAAARLQRPRAPAPAPGTASRSGASKVRFAISARSSRGAGPSIRSGQARQCAIGMRMSGAPSCAMIEPSRNSTRPCTIDCGCTRTSISLGRQREQVMRLDQFEALVHQRRGIDRDLRAHRPVRMLERLLRRRRADRLRASRCGTVRPRRSG